MNIRPNRVERVTNFEVRFGPAESAVADVLDSLEVNTLGVYPPDDADAVKLDLDASGAILLHSRATHQVDIADWLSAACQVIRYEEARDDMAKQAALAWYSTNAHVVLWPEDGCVCPPVGPAGFFGEIVLSQQLLDGLSNEPSGDDCLRAVLAHEFCHVFDRMRLVVPAFLDWDTFWNMALGDGVETGSCAQISRMHSLFLDNYGSKDELLMLEQFWPSKADQWFEAFQAFVSRVREKTR